MSVLLAKSGIPHVREYRFHSVRKWRFDYAVLDYKIAIEVEGGIFSSGRHTRGKGFANDCEKYNTATSCGWAVLRYPADDISQECIEQIMSVIRLRQNDGRHNNSI